MVGWIATRQKKRFFLLGPLLSILFFASLAGEGMAQDTNESEVVVRTLILLEKQMHGPADAESKKQAAKRIIALGQPLLEGKMSPDAAPLVAKAFKEGVEPPIDRKRYFGFWMLRALAAVNADDSESGIQAGLVIQRLGKDSKNEAVLNVMAALLEKGWLTALSPREATSAKPFVNSLGMKFVPVPITGGPTNGQKILLGTTEVRVKDFAIFIKESNYKATISSETYGVKAEDGIGEKNIPGSWDSPQFKQTGEHPVVCISWGDAKAFCIWLGRKEGNVYRLPSDHEWSCAVGIGLSERADQSMYEKDENLQGVYPWGKEWPPPTNAGNYAGSEAAIDHRRGQSIEGFDDGYPRTSPVGRFKVNKFGLYDLGGNVSEWCEEVYSWDGAKEETRVTRGGSWDSCLYEGFPNGLNSASRSANFLNGSYSIGFRCVLDANTIDGIK